MHASNGWAPTLEPRRRPARCWLIGLRFLRPITHPSCAHRSHQPWLRCLPVVKHTRVTRASRWGLWLLVLLLAAATRMADTAGYVLLRRMSGAEVDEWGDGGRREADDGVVVLGGQGARPHVSVCAPPSLAVRVSEHAVACARTQGAHVDREVHRVLERLRSVTADEHAFEQLRRRLMDESDFRTVDWRRDTEKEHNMYKHHVGLRGKPGSWRFSAQRFWWHAQGWVLLFLIGVTAGVVANLVNLAADWVSTLRQGVCASNWWRSKEACCGGARTCPEWHDWRRIVHGSSVSVAALGDTDPVNYGVYVLSAIMYAAVAAVLVKNFAPYAGGSGIPEVKTMLGGFTMRRFLGGWTLLVKCIGLALSVGSGMVLGKEVGDGVRAETACCCSPQHAGPLRTPGLLHWQHLVARIPTPLPRG